MKKDQKIHSKVQICLSYMKRANNFSQLDVRIIILFVYFIISPTCRVNIISQNLVVQISEYLNF